MWINKKKYQELEEIISVLDETNIRLKKENKKLKEKAILLENDVIMLNDERNQCKKIIADLEIKVTELTPKKRGRKPKEVK